MIDNTTPARTILLELDPTDFDALQEAMAVRQTFRIMPDGGGNLAGRLMAEIARDWLEMLDHRRGTPETQEGEDAP